MGNSAGRENYILLGVCFSSMTQLLLISWDCGTWILRGLIYLTAGWCNIVSPTLFLWELLVQLLHVVCPTQSSHTMLQRVLCQNYSISLNFIIKKISRIISDFDESWYFNITYIFKDKIIKLGRAHMILLVNKTCSHKNHLIFFHFRRCLLCIESYNLASFHRKQ